MPETANQGAASQPDIPTTSYTVTVVEQRIYRIPISGPIEYPDRGAQSSTTA
jgi:hypothetical protein